MFGTIAAYLNSGYTRGHLVPAADAAWSDASIQDASLLSNAAPQTAQLNGGMWNQFERKTRQLLLTESDADSVITGPLFEKEELETTGRSHVAVLSHFYKVLLAVRGEHKTMYAVIMPNTTGIREPLHQFAVLVEEVQQRSGLDFFSGLQASEQRQLESVRNTLPH